MRPSLQFQSTHPVWGATFCVPCKKYNDSISIHAPRMGCDVKVVDGLTKEQEFQSTHPVWGATHNRRKGLSGMVISIHAPRMGCDDKNNISTRYDSHFNPRTPYGVRHKVVVSGTDTDTFQSTHPVWGATWEAVARHPTRDISIHAPRMGCDPQSWSFYCQRSHFNPRTPYGVRPDFCAALRTSSAFQSTHPVWGATEVHKR